MLLQCRVDGIIGGMKKNIEQNTVKFTDKYVASITTEKTRKVYLEDGLYLYVTPAGLKSWRYEYRKADRKRATLTFGKYPTVTLAQARLKHLEARSVLASGRDPSQEKKVKKLILENTSKNTFEDVAKAWFDGKVARRSAVWGETHKLYLKRDLNPSLGTLPIAGIDAETLLAVLEKCQEKRGLKTADRVRQTAVQVFDYGKRKLKVTFNVARVLVDWTDGGILPKEHRAWLKAAELPPFLAAVDAYSGYLTTKFAATLLLLTMVRKRELTEAKWQEFDLDKAIWVVPPERMKLPTEEKRRRRDGHEVPLSVQAVKVLRELRPYCSGSDFLFPSNVSLEKPMSASTLNVMFKRMGYAGLLTPHGMRATASTILNEKGFRSDVIERQLAHVERNQVRRAYNHAEFLEERRALMQGWADYIDEIRWPQPSS